jgi:Amt family ammonium transporter
MLWRLTVLVPLFAGLLLLGPAASNAFAQDTDAFAQAETRAEPASPAELSDTETAETAEDVALPTVAQLGYSLDNIVLFLCAVLVIFMQAGFAMVVAGFVSAKHTVNVLFKNALDICVGLLLFWAIGYGIMYPTEGTNPPTSPSPYFSFGGFGVNDTLDPSQVTEGESIFHPQVAWLFQAAFAAAAATIVAGAVAGRMKFGAYLIYSAVLTGMVYPISGYWTWGGGWLDQIGFADFAGSCIVHAVGGFAGLAGAIVLGARIGRYTADGRPIAIPGHSLPLATLGVFVLWIGWYGFNPGSQLAFQGFSDSSTMMTVAVNTSLSAAAGAVAATFVSWILFSKPDLSMALNGLLGGLVGITANCNEVTNSSAMIIGAVAGMVVVAGIIVLDKLRIDDPVGAFPVHGLCGMWGCLAIPIFAGGDWAAQLTGVVAICGWSFATMFVLFNTLKMIGFLRVSPEEEEKGLDLSEHGMSAYSV